MKFYKHLGVFIVMLSILGSPMMPVIASSISSSGSDSSGSSEPNTSSEEVSSSEDNTIVLAVNEPVGFQSSSNYTNNYRSVGSTFFNNTNKYVYLSNGAGNSAGSFFTKNKIFLTNSTSAGFSTFFEMSVFAANGYADGFTFIVSRNINVLGNAGGAIGYGGITNSIAILFDNYNNGGQQPLCLSLGVNGTQGNCQYSGFVSGNFKIWIDYSRNTNGGRLEVRLHNRNDFNRPANPARAWDNISFDQIGNEFFTGFTAATGGESQVAYLKSWFFSASYSPNGIDPTEAANFVTDNIPPNNPKIEPYLIGEEWFFKPDPSSISEPNLTFIYTAGNNQQFTFYNPITARASFTTNDQTLYLYALDLAGNRSPGAGTYPYFRASFILNYPGADTITRFYPGYNVTYPVTDNISLYTPVRPGYRFEGWATSPVQSTNLITNFRFTANANFFARWSFLPYTVNFNTNGGTTIPSISTNINDGFSLPNNPTKANHTFVGWFLDDEFRVPLDLNNFAHSSVTLFAKWKVDTYVITTLNSINQTTNTFNFDYGTVIKTNDLTPNNQPGFFFDGFYVDEELTIPSSTNLTVISNQTIYEKWIDLRPVYALHQSVRNIQQPLTTAIFNQDALKLAREFLLALNQDQQQFVDEEVLALLQSLENRMIDLLAVEEVVQLIDDLGRIMSLDKVEELQDAVEAYANLTEAQKALFPNDRSHHLDDLKLQYSDLSQANRVETMVWEIPNNFGINDIDSIQNAVQAFDALLETEVALMDPETVARIRSAKGQLDQLIKCLGFIELIQAIGPDVTLDDEERINDAFLYYQNMQADELRFLDMQYYQYLITYSKIHQDMTIAQPVNELLSELPTVITLNIEEELLVALAAYENLSQDQQQYVDETLLEQLRLALNEIERLKNLGGGGGPIDPPIDPPVVPPVDQAYFPWIIIIVLVTWLGAYGLVNKKPKLIP
jgi:uncharacterized repeat protein (TIGR02543 family)